MRKKIAIVGGGPTGLFVFKRLVESGQADFEIDLFESKSDLGKGMPYGVEGASVEHITNVSGNEIPELPISLKDWFATLEPSNLEPFGLSKNSFSDYKVLPRLLFGQYLQAQFSVIEKAAERGGITFTIHRDTPVSDIRDDPSSSIVTVYTVRGEFAFDHVIICTGHNWPTPNEGKVPGYFDSPYPPAKIALPLNHDVAIRGSGLTAIDAIRTLARANGSFEREGAHIKFRIFPDCPDFKIKIHTRSGLLPAIRFHLEDPRLSPETRLSKEELDAHMASNRGFLSLDFIFEKEFKRAIKTRDRKFFKRIKDMTVEQFVDAMMDLRERSDPFALFKAEYLEAQESIRHKDSVYWKELLAALSFSMNYPAKHFSAEDMLRLHKTLMPLIAIIIAFVPQSSCEELIALHDANVLDLISVGNDSEVIAGSPVGAVYRYQDEGGKSIEAKYETFIDCTGQRHLSTEDFPFRSLINDKTASSAMVRFQSPANGERASLSGNKQVVRSKNGDYALKVPGIAIDDNFQVVDEDDVSNPRVYILSVAYIGGFNPDYSGLDFGEEASRRVVAKIFENA